MQPLTIAPVLAGAANLLLALFWLFVALVGSNGLDSARGGRLLGLLALVLAFGWTAGLFLARSLVQWGLAHGWSGTASVAAAVSAAAAEFLGLAGLTTAALFLWLAA